MCALAVLAAGCLFRGVEATADAQVSDSAPVVVIGGFSNVRHTEEHAYGEQLNLWRQGRRLLGLFRFTDGPQADFSTGLLEKVTFDSRTGRLGFEAYASQFRFAGTLQRDAVRGVLTRMHPTTGEQVSADRVVLKRSRDMTELMDGFASLEEWNDYVARVLKRLGPRDRFTPSRP